MVLVACGTAIATSTVVAIGIEEAMQERGVKVTTNNARRWKFPAWQRVLI